MKPIKNIQTNIDRRRKLRYIGYLLIVNFIVLFLLSNNYPSQSGFIGNLLLLNLALLFIAAQVRESLELPIYERIRHSAYNLNNSLNKKDTEKARFYLNEFAKHIVLFNNEIEKLSLQKHNVDVLNKVLAILKNKVYPDLLKENTDGCLEIVKNIQQAIEKEDINELSDLVQNYSFENTDGSNPLPYEEPSILKRYCTTYRNIIRDNFYNYSIFRLLVSRPLNNWSSLYSMNIFIFLC